MKTQKKITEKAKEPVYKHNIGSTTDFKVEAKLLVYAEEGTDEWKRQTNRFKAVEEKDKVRLYHTGPGEVIEMKSEVKSIIEKQKELIEHQRCILDIFEYKIHPESKYAQLESELAALEADKEEMFSYDEVKSMFITYFKTNDGRWNIDNYEELIKSKKLKAKEVKSAEELYCIKFKFPKNIIPHLDRKRDVTLKLSSIFDLMNEFANQYKVK